MDRRKPESIAKDDPISEVPFLYTLNTHNLVGRTLCVRHCQGRVADSPPETAQTMSWKTVKCGTTRWTHIPTVQRRWVPKMISSWTKMELTIFHNCPKLVHLLIMFHACLVTQLQIWRTSAEHNTASTSSRKPNQSKTTTQRHPTWTWRTHEKHKRKSKPTFWMNSWFKRRSKQNSY